MITKAVPTSPSVCDLALLSPVATKLWKGDIGLPSVRQSARPSALNNFTINSHITTPPPPIGFFYWTALSDGGHLSVTRMQFFGMYFTSLVIMSLDMAFQLLQNMANGHIKGEKGVAIIILYMASPFYASGSALHKLRV